MRGLKHPIFSACCLVLLAAWILASAQPLSAQSYTSPPYTLTTLAGTAGVAGSSDGQSVFPNANILQTTFPLFNSPRGVAVDGQGNVYVADSGNNTIRKITPFLQVTTFAGSAGTSGFLNALGTAARFNNPTAIAVQGSTIYVLDAGNNAVRMIDFAGNVTTLASGLTLNGNSSMGVGGLGGNSAVYVTSGTNLLRVLNGYAYTAAYNFGSLGGLAVDASGNVYVSDSQYNALYYINFSTSKVTPFIGGVTGSGLAIDGNNNVFAATGYVVLEVTQAGAITIMAGTENQPGTSDGNGTAAKFSFVGGVAVDEHNNIYVADTGGDLIREGLQDIPLSALASITSLQVGESVAFNLTDDSGNSVYYRVKKSGGGPIRVYGPNLNIVIFTGSGPVDVEQCTAPGFDQHIINQGSEPAEASQPATVPAPPVATLAVSGPASALTGTPCQLTVTPQDQYGDTIIGSADTFQFTSTDGAAILPAPGAITTTNGSGTFNVTFNTVGNQTLTVTDQNSGLQSTPISITVNQPFSNWEDQYTLANPAPSATPEYDGVPTLLKYLFNINPSVPMNTIARAALPKVGTDSTTNPGTRYLTLTFREYAWETGIAVNIQTSPDLQNWATVTPDITKQVGTDATTGDPIMEYEVNTDGATTEFIRLDVTQP